MNNWTIAAIAAAVVLTIIIVVMGFNDKEIVGYALYQSHSAQYIAEYSETTTELNMDMELETSTDSWEETASAFWFVSAINGKLEKQEGTSDEITQVGQIWTLNTNNLKKRPVSTSNLDRIRLKQDFIFKLLWGDEQDNGISKAEFIYLMERKGEPIRAAFWYGVLRHVEM